MNNLLYTHFLLGPMMLVLAYLFKRFPPPKINYWYGYRTPRSMKNQETWYCANLFSAHALIVVSILTCLVQLITYALLEERQSIYWSAIFLGVSVVAVIPLTEIHLKKNFG